MNRGAPDDLLLGEWACLGIVYPAPTHGFAVAARLTPRADVGRVWSMSRPLTYRSLDQLAARAFIRPVGEEPGSAGPNRVVLAATRLGRARLRGWLQTPVGHLRDVRSELLLKLVLADLCGIDVTAMLGAQRDRCVELAAAHAAAAAESSTDVVALWRAESSAAALRFVERVLGA